MSNTCSVHIWLPVISRRAPFWDVVMPRWFTRGISFSFGSMLGSLCCTNGFLYFWFLFINWNLCSFFCILYWFQQCWALSILFQALMVFPHVYFHASIVTLIHFHVHMKLYKWIMKFAFEPSFPSVVNDFLWHIQVSIVDPHHNYWVSEFL